jgi:hypothetical protein
MYIIIFIYVSTTFCLDTVYVKYVLLYVSAFRSLYVLCIHC